MSKESLLTTNDEASREASYQIDIPQLEREFPLMGKSEYLILPLSLENNSTLTGSLAGSSKFHANMQVDTSFLTKLISVMILLLLENIMNLLSWCLIIERIPLP